MEAIENRSDVPSVEAAEAGNSAEPADAAGPLLSARTLISRRTAIGGGLAGLAGLGGLMMFPAQLLAATTVPADPFIILLKGLYQPAVNVPNLSLHTVDIDDSWIRTKIYPVKGVAGDPDPKKAFGNFFVNGDIGLCAYNLPKGSLAMAFEKGADFEQKIPDGTGGTWLIGNFDLEILEGTGIYRSFRGGHNVMVDILHQINETDFFEHCVCIISRP